MRTILNGNPFTNELNAEGRRRKKMMAKMNWFKKRKDSEEDGGQDLGGSPAKMRRYEGSGGDNNDTMGQEGWKTQRRWKHGSGWMEK